MTAVCALILSAVLEGIAMTTATDRALKALGPLDAVKVFHTSFLIGETLNELQKHAFFRVSAFQSENVRNAGHGLVEKINELILGFRDH